jgi:hypothetical protein
MIPDGGSFRDRSNQVFETGGTVLRALDDGARENWEALVRTHFFERNAAARRLIRTRRLDAIPPGLVERGAWAAVLEHDRVPFVSYPYEWTFSMLRDAALQQLDLLSDALDDGFVLKDASAFNTQWIGARPVFIDIPSFERFEPGQPWEGYRQFCMMFLYPLMLQAYRGVPFQPWLRGSIDGIEPEAMSSLMGGCGLLRRGVLTHVHLHARLQRNQTLRRQNARSLLRDAGFGPQLIKANARGLRRLIERLEWKASSSTWSAYADTHSYDTPDVAVKAEFVRRAAAARRWRLAWDLGGNVGNFSRIAAEHADYVVLMDGDALTVDLAYRRLQAERSERILPLCVDLAKPSPATGWRGRERKTLEDRGKPDLVLALALIHHIVIGANVPLAAFIEWLADLGAVTVVEFVTKDDEMVVDMLRNRRDQFFDYDLDNFERRIAARFEIRDRIELKDGRRVLFALEPR